MKPLLSELFLPCSGMHSPVRANRHPLTTITGAQRASGQTHPRFLDPIIFLAELTFAVSLILGLGVRLIGVLGIIYVLHLWLGIYRPGSPAEWPWEYIFLAIVMFPCDRDVFLCAACRRPQPRSRCVAAPQRGSCA
jgi:uncharacterized membrane protein YphA (DoxX/SURF4 family)